MPTQIAQIKARIADNSRAIRKMRNLEMDDLSHKVMFHELVRGSLALFVAIALPAAAVAQKLGSYIGVPAVQLIETLGEPLLRTPNELWYSTPADIVGGRYAAPIISGSGGPGGLSVGSIYQPLSLAERPCSISVAIGATGLLETVEQSGPGCNKFIYLLRQSKPNRPAEP